jgi:hypothetical protein
MDRFMMTSTFYAKAKHNRLGLKHTPLGGLCQGQFGPAVSSRLFLPVRCETASRSSFHEMEPLNYPCRWIAPVVLAVFE